MYFALRDAMSRNAKAQGKLQPMYERERDVEVAARPDDIDQASERRADPELGRVERVLRQHPSLVHELE